MGGDTPLSDLGAGERRYQVSPWPRSLADWVLQATTVGAVPVAPPRPHPVTEDRKLWLGGPELWTGGSCTDLLAGNESFQCVERDRRLR